MNVEKFKCLQEEKVSKLLDSRLGFSYNITQKLLRKKDIKINGVRISEDKIVSVGEEIEVFFSDDMISKIKVLYEDDNIIVANKPRELETVSDNNNSLLKKLSKQIGCELQAVHRLDRNTEGLVVFAKNEPAKNELDSAFKNRTLEKYYLALAYGVIEKEEDAWIAYLKKDSEKSLVYISDKEKYGYEKIITKYKLKKQFENYALVEVELVTGKTHQIRAHFAHNNHFVIGDEKYGDSKINKSFKKKYQCLCAYKIVFHFDKNSKLFYLNEKTVSLNEKDIIFCQNL